MEEAVTKSLVCELCEAGCGLSVDVLDGQVVKVRGNERDVLSRGFVCPKGLATIALDRDPDRLRTPVQRRADGRFEPITWDAAFSLVADRLGAIQREHGRDAVAVYMGTPIVHKHGALLMRGALLGALRTRNSTSAGSQDSSPRFAASYFLYGSAFSVPVPDVDRTSFFLCIGANPLVSNGSLLTAPNLRERLRAIQARGGKLVVVDPRRTETAEVADEHVAIRPGTDAAFLLAMVHVLWTERRIDEAALEQATRGWPTIRAQLAAYAPERVARYTGVPAETIRRVALEFADASTSVAYARLGVCNQAFGTLASYAVDLLNLVAGRLGQVGGALFATPAIDLTRLARLTGSDGYARFRSRVRGLPEIAGDLPATVLAEEMQTPGDGQVRGFVTYAGNPVSSTPNGRRLAAALSGLQFMVSIDYYVNETTRFADVILPPCGPFAEDHVDLFFANFAAHNGLRWTPGVVARGADERHDWEILLELAERLGGGPTGVRAIDQLLRVARRFGYRYALDTTLELVLRTGPYGDRFLPWRSGLRGEQVRAAPDGIDLGPLQPGFARRIFHADGRIELAAGPITLAFAQLEAALDHSPADGELLMIGRRELRSNNSWMHNLEKLVAGQPRCLLFVHPTDAARAGVRDGDSALLESRVYSAEVPVRVTDEVMPGVVSLPHGWGHAASAPYQRVAAQHVGVSANDWTDDQDVESIVGQSILNGVRVRLRAVAPRG
ncbi:MAG TPA: molybdopterin-dependent oxidoreductase [Polyangiales bacterium]